MIALVVAVLSERLRRLPTSEPLLALLMGVLLGPSVTGLLDVRPLAEDHAMPIMAVATAGLSAWLLGVGLGAAPLLRAALSPTAPVLASSVVTGGPAEEDLPARDRQALSWSPARTPAPSPEGRPRWNPSGRSSGPSPSG